MTFVFHGVQSYTINIISYRVVVSVRWVYFFYAVDSETTIVALSSVCTSPQTFLAMCFFFTKLIVALPKFSAGEIMIGANVSSNCGTHCFS